MSYEDILKEYFPDIITDSYIFSQIINAIGIEFDNLYGKKANLALQFSVDTATWALDIYEKELNIKTDITKELEYRRSVIKSKWRSDGGKFENDLLKRVCDSFTNGNVDVTYDGVIHVKFTSIVGTPPNMDDLKAAVELIKPAYKLLDYKYLYLFIPDVNSLTIGNLINTTINKFAFGGE